ncbi:GNAT family N-acetyltransferase [Amphibacillus indicireducens]|uniref:N-acetyltransferase domain-containing protein n=1 Tax=Amphibacillus indicireducens TaxID=1076330 RepID=A0ABP7VVL4_9BACI
MEMMITLKTISDSRQYPQLVKWYYQANPISYELGYGRFANKIITAQLANQSPLMRNNFLQGIFIHEKLVGFLITYPTDKSRQIDQKSYEFLKRHMSRLSYLRKIRFYQKVAQILNIALAEDSYYLHSLVIDPAYQGQGIGTAVIKKLLSRYEKLSLYVNDQNTRAVQFYLKNGFKIVHHGQIRYQNIFYGEYLMHHEVNIK